VKDAWYYSVQLSLELFKKYGRKSEQSQKKCDGFPGRKEKGGQ
jgi:hypothetical protein